MSSLATQATPLCVTVSVWPAIVAVRGGGLPELVGGMVTCTWPLPVPLAGVAPRPVAAHGQAPLELMFMVATPPAAVTLIADGLMASEHAEPNWVT